MYAPHDRPYSGVVRAARHTLVMFDPELLLGRVAAPAAGADQEAVRLTGDQPVSAGAARQ